MHIVEHEFGEPKNSEETCRERELTFHAPLYLTVRLEVMETGELKEQKIFMGDIPMMTTKGTFIINGAERVVVSQLVRSPGVYFSVDKDAATEGNLASAKLIPYRGAWLEFETNSRGLITVKVDRKRKAAATTLLRAMGLVTDEEILGAFEDIDDNPSIKYIQNTLERGSQVLEREEVFRKDELRKLWSKMFTGEHLPEREFDEKGAQRLGVALLDLYRRLRPGEPANLENARNLVESLFYNPRRYDLGGVGRYKMNTKLGIAGDPDTRLLGKDDIVALVRYLVQLNNGTVRPDDIDHLGNRRVRAVGELIQNQMRVGFLRMERVIRERMTMAPEPEQATPNALINIRPVVAAVREFFGGSQLSQFMDQINPLAELTHKRRLSALGPGGLSRERAGFDVRDVHYSHYGRICPIETPEGPNIGLLGSLATFGKTNAFGFIETPYRLVVSTLNSDDTNLIGRTTAESVVEAEKVVLRKGKAITKGDLAKLAEIPRRQVQVKPFVAASAEVDSVILQTSDLRIEGAKLAEDVLTTGSKVMAIPVGSNGTARSVELVKGTVITPIYARILRSQPDITVTVESVVYLSADQEDRHVIAQANTVLDKKGQFVDSAIESRSPATASAGNEFSRKLPDEVAYMDVSPMQIVSVSTSLIPFLEHDDANRALMGSNMQRQAVPLLVPEAPLVGTGMEGRVAVDSGQVIISKARGIATSVSGRAIVVTDAEGTAHSHALISFARTNQGTCLTHRPIVHKGDVVEVGQPLADSSSTDQGNLALGQNVLVAFMSWEGYNFEDAIIISEALSKNDGFTSVHIERYEVDARDTKLGAEEITRDIPNVGEEGLADLDEDGIIRIGAEVTPGDILVGKITPKGETELTAEEKLLRAIFGEKARDVKDTSLRVPHGERGKVIDVRVFNQQEDKEELAPGVNQLVRVWVAQTRKITAGDKMAGRHGNKGVISRILPVEDMPYLPDGTPVDIILNPIGVPSRMNLGQVLETHLGWAAHQLGFRALTPVFDGARDEDIEDVLARAWFVSESGAIDRYSSSKNPSISIETLEEWLKGYGYTAAEMFDTSLLGVAKDACLKIWLNQQGIDAQPKTPAEMESLVAEVSQQKGEAPPHYGKVKLTDGRTGETFDQPITVGYIYMMKLVHLVEDKIHARSTGPYSLITQQPLGGKAQFGGQRFGEMEVWALEAYSGAYNLQEILTVKSDDVVGRVRTYEAIVKGDDVVHPGVPESFQVLLKELQSLGLAVELTTESDEIASPVAFVEGLDEDAAIDDFSDILGEDDGEELNVTGQDEAPDDQTVNIPT
jgi:DNA-directed RNA polymerase subunit beta